MTMTCTQCHALTPGVSWITCGRSECQEAETRACAERVATRQRLRTRTERPAAQEILTGFPGLSREERRHVATLRNRLAYLEKKLAEWDPSRGPQSKAFEQLIQAERGALHFALRILAALPPAEHRTPPPPEKETP